MFKKKNKIDKMITSIIRREGGFVDHPSDRGGPTKYGITQETLTFWRENPCSIEDVKCLKESEAREIYRISYYEVPGISLLPEKIQPFMFDSCVNHGAYKAIILLQNAINRLQQPNPYSWHTAQLRQDGIIGHRTASAAQEFIDNAALYLLINRRKEFYREIVHEDPTQKVFLNGWLRRLTEFK